MKEGGGSPEGGNRERWFPLLVYAEIAAISGRSAVSLALKHYNLEAQTTGNEIKFVTVQTPFGLIYR